MQKSHFILTGLYEIPPCYCTCIGLIMASHSSGYTVRQVGIHGGMTNGFQVDIPSICTGTRFKVERPPSL